MKVAMITYRTSNLETRALDLGGSGLGFDSLGRFASASSQFFERTGSVVTPL